MIIADNQTVYIGSANMDWKSLIQVKEMGIVLNDYMMANDAAKIFDAYMIAGKLGHIPTEWPATLETEINADTPYYVTNDNLVYLSTSPDQFTIPERVRDIDSLVHAANVAKEYLI